jgi:hypothetical protein
MKTLLDTPQVPAAREDESQIPENILFDARGVTPRVVCLSLLLAAFFGLVIPIIDVKMSNTYLGAQHLPVGALAALMLLLLIVNPLLRVLARTFRSAAQRTAHGLYNLSVFLFGAGSRSRKLLCAEHTRRLLLRQRREWLDGVSAIFAAVAFAGSVDRRRRLDTKRRSRRARLV